jgi:hypothetical protein
MNYPTYLQPCEFKVATICGKQKIDMADHIVVVTDVDKPYIGDSTNGEIQYAAKAEKPIRWALEAAV